MRLRPTSSQRTAVMVGVSASLACAVLLVGCEIDYHPEGWERPSAHGMAALTTSQDCLLCHGEDLTGGIAEVSCDTCHVEGWRTDCDYCHSEHGELGMESAFKEHDRHVPALNTHVAYDCALCHADHEDVLSPGHMFDDTPGQVEVAFIGLATGTQWAAGQCSENYCHGNGQQRGTVNSGELLDCNGCHVRRGLSGEHGEHLGEGVSCEDCHGEVVVSRDEIRTPSLHVNGRKDFTMPDEITESDLRCSGRCHGERHSQDRW